MYYRVIDVLVLEKEGKKSAKDVKTHFAPLNIFRVESNSKNCILITIVG